MHFPTLVCAGCLLLMPVANLPVQCFGVEQQMLLLVIKQSRAPYAVILSIAIPCMCCIVTVTCICVHEQRLYKFESGVPGTVDGIALGSVEHST